MIHNYRKADMFFLPLLLLIISGCKKERITPSGNQVTVTRHPGTFKAISTNSDINIHITRSDVYTVQIKGSDNLIKQFGSTVINNELRLGYIKGNISANDLEVWVSLPQLEKITSSGSGHVEVLGKFPDQELFSTLISGSGNIGVTGFMRTNSLKSCSSGSGATDLRNVRARIAEFELSGSGDIKGDVEDQLKVNMTGSGNVYYSGNPAVVSTTKGSGKVIKLVHHD